MAFAQTSPSNNFEDSISASQIQMIFGSMYNDDCDHNAFIICEENILAVTLEKNTFSVLFEEYSVTLEVNFSVMGQQTPLANQVVHANW